MSKGHRDNHAARMKRGRVAFEKKAKRRTHSQICPLCGNPARNLQLGICEGCNRQQMGLNRDGTERKSETRQ